MTQTEKRNPLISICTLVVRESLETHWKYSEGGNTDCICGDDQRDYNNAISITARGGCYVMYVSNAHVVCEQYSPLLFEISTG